METIESDKSVKVKFAVSGKMARLLGRESVSSEVVALFELVKNAYDADSPKVTVTFDRVPGNEGKIIVKDYGDGMTEEDIVTKWLIIGTDSKERKKITAHGRRVVGEKGIGRFATERLAHKATLIACPKDGVEVLELIIDWDLYEAENARFDTVEHSLTRRQRKESDAQGLEIILEQLRDDWDQNKIDALSEQLSGLVLPTGFETSYRFEIELIAPKFHIQDTKIQSGLLKKAPYRLKATLSDGQILVSAWIKDEQVIGATLGNHRIPNTRMRCGPATLHYYGFQRDPSMKKGEREWEKYYGPLSLQLINDMLKVHSGIRLYRDRFRVKPYGDPTNDWTNREGRARAQAGILPNDRTIGWVEISSEKNPEIIDTTTREKIIENEAFSDLIYFVDASIQKLNVIIAKRRREKFTRKRDLVEQFDDLIQDVTTISMPSERKSDLTTELAEIKKEVQEVRETEEDLMSELEAYRNLASLGIMTGAVSHEIRQDLSLLLTASEQLLLLREEIEPLLHNHSFELSISDLNDRVNNIKEYMTLIRAYTSALKTKSSNFRKKEPVNLHQVVTKVFQGFTGVFGRWNIQPVNTVPINVQEIVMFKADLQSVLINFISNSIKAIKSNARRTAGQHFGNKSQENIIKISSRLDSEYFVFSVSDNGVGVHPDIRNSIFDMFVSYNEDEDSGESGSGLGLTIVKEIVERYSGVVFLDKPELDEGATFTVKIPLSAVRKS